MFRSVEGQAASDEEEEKWTGDQQSQGAEVKKLLATLPCCNSGYVSGRCLYTYAFVTLLGCPLQKMLL